jgi:hypothetical protein
VGLEGRAMFQFGGITCKDEIRRSQERLSAVDLNGIDYIEVFTDSQTDLHVHFIKDLISIASPAVDLIGRPGLFRIDGGVRIKKIQVLDVKLSDDHLVVQVDKAGDFSTYTLFISPVKDLDPAFAQCDFSFKQGCPSRIDCKPRNLCPPKLPEDPVIDYMAKDYASFRQALIDLIPSMVPNWKELHEADLGMVLLELLAYAGDQLSYYQDSVANEAYLETAHQRISVRRHAKLIDYGMHDGASSQVFVHFSVDSDFDLPPETQVLTRIDKPLGTSTSPPGTIIPDSLREEALDAADAVFETSEEAHLKASLERIRLHTWGNLQCCLPKGAMTVDLEGDFSKTLCEGDILLLEEVLGPQSGLKADADPSHRQIVRLTKVEPLRDPLQGDMPLTRVHWDKADMLEFPLCLSTTLGGDGSKKIEDVSIASGNLVLSYHGRKKCETHSGPTKPSYPLQRRAFRLRLNEGPLSCRIESDGKSPVKDMPKADPHLAKHQILRVVIQPSEISCDKLPPANSEMDWSLAPRMMNGETSTIPSLMDSGPFDKHFIVETDNFGRAVLRFGDSEYGMSPPETEPGDPELKNVAVVYRIGVGRSGNIGQNSLGHIIFPPGAMINVGQISVRNPLPSWGGIDPEPVEVVKQLAPAVFHTQQLRAVTETDYAGIAEKLPEVSKAVATFRWTGSWYTVFITIDPYGTNEVTDELKKKVREHVESYTLAGYDLEIKAPIYVPLLICVDVCISSNHFKSDVEEVLLTALSNKVLPDGSLGFFHPDRFTFGQALYLSQLYEAIQKVEGVDSAVVTTLNRLGKSTGQDLEKGFLQAGALEVVRLDNDPSFPDNGVLRLNMRGGK